MLALGFYSMPQLTGAVERSESAKGQKNITFSNAAWSRGPLRGGKGQEFPYPNPGFSLQLWQINSSVLICKEEILPTYLLTGGHRANCQGQLRLCPRTYYIKKLNSEWSKALQVSLIFDIWSFQPTEVLTAAVFSLTSKRSSLVRARCIQHGCICTVWVTGSLAFLSVWAAPTKLMGPKK